MYKTDFIRYYGEPPTKIRLLKALFNPCYSYVYLIRKAADNNRKSIKGVIYRIAHRILSVRLGFQIPVSTEIGPGFYIGHYGTLVISGRSKIGKNVNVTHGVTIGAIINGKRKGAPKIGDRVWIGTGATLVGGITIGENVLIAPGAFVNIDIPPNSVVIGNPAVVKSKEDATKDYIQNIIS